MNPKRNICTVPLVDEEPQRRESEQNVASHTQNS